MKRISHFLRMIVANFGIVLAFCAVYLGLQTYKYLSDKPVTSSERLFENYRLGGQIILIAIGIALILLAAPLPRKNYVFRFGWQFYLGLFMMFTFISGFLQYVRQFGTPAMKLTEQDLWPSVAADIAILGLAVLLLKWKSKPASRV